MAKRILVGKASRILREVVVLQGQGSTAGEACRKSGVTEYTYYRCSPSDESGLDTGTIWAAPRGAMGIARDDSLKCPP